MDRTPKKRKADDNGAAALRLTPEDVLKILEPFTREDLLSVISTAMAYDPSSSVLSSVRAVADPDRTRRKLFVRGLGWDTTTDSLRSLFSSFGDLDEAVVISDKLTGKSKGYGFVTFRHVDCAFLALKEPSKIIDGRMTMTQLASAGNAGGGPVVPPPDVTQRKIYVGGVPADMSADRLLALFSPYGEIEEGPLGFDWQTRKFRGYALFVYRHPESAQAAIAEPIKYIDGHNINCKMAIDGKIGVPAGNPAAAAAGAGSGSGGVDSRLMWEAPSLPGSNPSQFGGPETALASFGAGHHNMNSPLSGINAGLSSMSDQLPPCTAPWAGAGLGGFGSGFGGPFMSSSQYPGSGGLGVGSSLYHWMPPGSGGLGSDPEGWLYSMGHAGQHHQQPGSVPGQRVLPGGGMYQGIHHYY